MNIMTRWDGNDGLFPAALGSLNELFRSVFDQGADFAPEWMSDRISGKMLDVEIGEKEVKVTLPLPGCSADEIEVEMLGDVLTVRAERREKGEDGEEKRYLRRERSAMSCEESVKLPVKVLGQKASANCSDGVLTVRLPREEEVVDKAHVVKVQ